MKDCEIITKCRLCQHEGLTPAIEFPDTPLANEYFEQSGPQEKFPLVLCCCDNCGHYQLSVSISPSRLFRNYLYVAGTSPVNVKHFNDYAKQVVRQCNLQKDDLVVEIASNDSTLLKAFKNKGMRVIGVEPAVNLAKISNDQGIETIPEFFTEAVADQIVQKYGKAKFACANNVLAHVDNFDEIFSGIDKILDDEGIFAFEVSYFKDVVEKTLIGLNYHEHSSQHLIGPLRKYFDSRGIFKIISIDKIPNHGGSLRIFIKKMNNRKDLPSFTILKYELEEKDIKQNIEIFKSKVQAVGNKLNSVLQEYKKIGSRIAILGYPAKATTELYTLGIDPSLIDLVCDDNILKQNKLTPGYQLYIHSADKLYTEKIDVILCMGWNFAESLMEKHKDLSCDWIIPLPEFKIIFLRGSIIEIDKG
jgi:hypothetical protein